jgi:Collagen triple helix repeat (20 copies)/Head domain of trimeric autotransporter adhesin
MKQKFLLFAVLLMGLSSISKAQNNVGVNTTTPHPSAALDVQSTSQGMLVPRMTAAQRDSISLPATGLLVYQSDMPAGFYYFNGTVWSLLGATGANGVNGTNGTNGTDGVSGTNGIDGINGTNGIDGAKGLDGKSAYELAVDAGYTGTEAAWLLSLQGVNGSNGTNGTDGFSGTNGINGINGTNGLDGAKGLDGKSAYELAVDAGYTGTEAAWLLSLQGANGSNGTDGWNGMNGSDGVNGTDGLNGLNGLSAYQEAVSLGFVGSDTAWLLSLHGTNGVNGQGIAQGGTAGQVLAKIDATDFNTQWITPAAGDSSQLQKITEPSSSTLSGYTSGWRILGRDTANYGDIGTNAIDLSFSDGPSTTRGATGSRSIAMGDKTTASGGYSTAMGVNTTAVGNGSTAMGSATTASGANSTAIGTNTTASGSGSTALGASTAASGASSTAIGASTTASGSSSTAMGQGTNASGQRSTAMGHLSAAVGSVSTAIGSSTIASGPNATSMGAATKSKSYGELAIGFNNDTLAVVSNNISNDSNRIFTVGNGSNTNNRKTAFVIQQDGNVGINQRRPTEKLDINGSIKIVDGTQGAGKVLMSDANGKASWQTAAGGGASQLEKITEGGHTGYRILGSDTASYGDIGENAIDLSSSFSNSTTAGATGQFGLASGFQTSASGFASTALGYGSSATNQASVALGYFNKATGPYATAFGRYATASGYAAKAIGSFVNASGAGSTAFGTETNAIGNNSTAFGDNTKAKSYNETTFGAYNDTLASSNPSTPAGDSNRIFTVGNGTSSAPKTAFVIQQDGNVGVGDRQPTSTLDVDGSLSLPIDYFSNSVTLTGAQYTVIMTAGGKTITLPAASTCKGRIYKLVHAGGMMASSNTISPNYIQYNGFSTSLLSTSDGLTLQSDGTNWRQIP